ncbi:tropomyosin-like, partial [Limulus polyphemus]|uniref:Tropomyosin-like n=1 Tax=Limulus polyphemus TaxID=6850 RepID=A0ABM1BZB2_LIMPO
MEAIKKKMQVLKEDKENAVDRAEVAEQQCRDANARAEKAEEEARILQQKIQCLENELDSAQELVTDANARLAEKDKSLQNVGFFFFK